MIKTWERFTHENLTRFPLWSDGPPLKQISEFTAILAAKAKPKRFDRIKLSSSICVLSPALLSSISPFEFWLPFGYILYIPWYSPLRSHQIPQFFTMLAIACTNIHHPSITCSFGKRCNSTSSVKSAPNVWFSPLSTSNTWPQPMASATRSTCRKNPCFGREEWTRKNSVVLLGKKRGSFRPMIWWFPVDDLQEIHLAHAGNKEWVNVININIYIYIYIYTYIYYKE